MWHHIERIEGVLDHELSISNSARHVEKAEFFIHQHSQQRNPVQQTNKSNNQHV